MVSLLPKKVMRKEKDGKKTIILNELSKTLVIDGNPITIKKILNIGDSYITVEHLDGRIESIPISKISSWGMLGEIKDQKARPMITV